MHFSRNLGERSRVCLILAACLILALVIPAPAQEDGTGFLPAWTAGQTWSSYRSDLQAVGFHTYEFSNLAGQATSATNSDKIEDVHTVPPTPAGQSIPVTTLIHVMLRRVVLPPGGIDGMVSNDVSALLVTRGLKLGTLHVGSATGPTIFPPQPNCVAKEWKPPVPPDFQVGSFVGVIIHPPEPPDPRGQVARAEGQTAAMDALRYGSEALGLVYRLLSTVETLQERVTNQQRVIRAQAERAQELRRELAKKDEVIELEKKKVASREEVIKKLREQLKEARSGGSDTNH